MKQLNADLTLEIVFWRARNGSVFDFSFRSEGEGLLGYGMMKLQGQIGILYL